MMDLAVNKESFTDYVKDLESLLDLNIIINDSELGFHHRIIAMCEKIELISVGVEALVSVSDEVILNEISLCESHKNRNSGSFKSKQEFILKMPVTVRFKSPSIFEVVACGFNRLLGTV